DGIGALFALLQRLLAESLDLLEQRVAGLPHQLVLLRRRGKEQTHEQTRGERRGADDERLLFERVPEARPRLPHPLARLGAELRRLAAEVRRLLPNRAGDVTRDLACLAGDLAG